MTQEPIRVLHFADTHVGMENYGKTDPDSGLSTRVVDFLRRMDDLVLYATDHEADLIIFAGDAFKTRNPNPTYQREFAHRIRELSQVAPVVLLVGNHDVPPTVLKASSIEIYDTLGVPNVWVGFDYEGRVIETKRGPVYVATAPYPMRSRLLANMNTTGKSIAETDQILASEFDKLLQELAAEADQHDMPRILTGHFSVSGAVLGSERSIMLGRDIEVSKSTLADDRWDYIALGHIHKHQNLTEGRLDAPPLVYAGSLERIDFGEEGDPKGFCWVNLSREETTWEFVEVAARPFVTLRADLRQSNNPTQHVIDQIAKYDLHNAVVRVLLDFSPESASRFNEGAVTDTLKRSGAFHIAALRKNIEEADRARLGASPEGLTPPQLLAQYLLAKDIPEARREELMQAAEALFAEDEE